MPSPGWQCIIHLGGCPHAEEPTCTSVPYARGGVCDLKNTKVNDTDVSPVGVGTHTLLMNERPV